MSLSCSELQENSYYNGHYLLLKAHSAIIGWDQTRDNFDSDKERFTLLSHLNLRFRHFSLSIYTEFIRYQRNVYT